MLKHLKLDNSPTRPKGDLESVYVNDWDKPVNNSKGNYFFNSLENDKIDTQFWEDDIEKFRLSEPDNDEIMSNGFMDDQFRQKFVN